SVLSSHPATTAGHRLLDGWFSNLVLRRHVRAPCALAPAWWRGAVRGACNADPLGSRDPRAHREPLPLCSGELSGEALAAFLLGLGEVGRDLHPNPDHEPLGHDGFGWFGRGHRVHTAGVSHALSFCCLSRRSSITSWCEQPSSPCRCLIARICS